MPANADLLRRHRRLLTPLALMLGGTAVLLDCMVQQLLIDGRPDPGIIARWATSTLLPWMIAVYAIRRPLERRAPLARGTEVALLIATLGLSVTLDLLLFRTGPWSAADTLARAQARLPIMLAVPLLARLAVQHSKRPDRVTSPTNELLAGALRHCRTCTAAGNYVELDDGRRRRLIRATMREAEAVMGDGYVRIHRATIIAWSLIDHVERGRHGICGVRLTDGRRLSVGRAYRKRLRAI